MRISAMFMAIALSWTGASFAGPMEDGAAAFAKGDFSAALGAWLPLAEAGEPAAQFNLGILHDQGQGVPKDAAQAARWYRMAAEKGDAAAAFNLGLMLESGDGLDRDLAEAARWFEAAAAAGDLLAQFRIGEIYLDGRGVESDPAAAIAWLEKSAAQNHAPAMFALRQIYTLGKGGIPMDLGKANGWSEKADLAIMSDEGAGACTARSTPRNETCRRQMPKL